MGELLDVLGDIEQFLGQVSEVLAAVSEVLNVLATVADYNDEVNQLLEDMATSMGDVPYIPQHLIDAVRDGARCMRAANFTQDEAAFHACREQTQAAIAAAQAYANQLFDADFMVDFRPNLPPEQWYGLDTQRYELLTEQYPQRQIKGQPYRTPWISTSTETAGMPLLARRRDGGSMDSLIFITANGNLDPNWTNSATQATHPAQAAAGDQETKAIYAAYPNPNATEANRDSVPPNILAGQVNMVIYTPVRKRVHIVPVGNAPISVTAASLEAGLNAIYKPAVAEWTVLMQENLSVANFESPLEQIPTAPLSNYTPQMIQIREALKQQAYYNPNDYYLLVVPEMEDASRLGFMSRKRAFGFLNAASLRNAELFTHTAAHELGHGAFHLQHIFDRFPDLRPGATDNLMDYGQGRDLYKYQWDNIHEPESNFSLFDEEGEGASKGYTTMDIILVNDREFSGVNRSQIEDYILPEIKRIFARNNMGGNFIYIVTIQGYSPAKF